MYFLNTEDPIIMFQKTLNRNIYVDKSLLIDQMNKEINSYDCYICITRPRRFGKTMNANMLGAYYSKGYDSHELFDGLEIAKCDSYEKHLNKHNVIYIDFSRMPDPCENYTQYIEYIKMQLFSDINEAYNIEKQPGLSIGDYLKKTKDSFIFILDEWDCIFYKKFMTQENEEAYLEFLKGLLKNQPYVELAYMTGVLPIAKYSSGSALNRHCPPFGVFVEFNMLKSSQYSEFFGFTEEETKALSKQSNSITYDELAYWYNGYLTTNGKRLFNPRSVNLALTYEECVSYWTETGPMDEIAFYIEKNIDDVKEDIVNLVSGVPIDIKLKGYSATESALRTRNEILSAMVVYGFLSYHNEILQIPNHELMLKFEEVLERNSFKEVAEIVKQSQDMLEATINKDSETVAKYLEEVQALWPTVRDREIPFFKYNDENSLSCVITLCYLQARNVYDITREDKSGKGYVDFLFKPLVSGYPAIVLELKYDKTAEEAINQIKEKNYIDRVRDCKEILLVGINYSEYDNKKHTCIIESIQNA